MTFRRKYRPQSQLHLLGTAKWAYIHHLGKTLSLASQSLQTDAMDTFPYFGQIPILHTNWIAGTAALLERWLPSKSLLRDALHWPYSKRLDYILRLPVFGQI